MRKLLLCFGLIAALTACDPYKAKFQTFVDQDVREIEEFYGPVWDAYDRQDGLRVFQWGRFGPYVRPPVSSANLEARYYQNSPLYNPATRLGNYNTHHLRCWYNAAARWEDASKRWIVEEIELPANRCDP